MLAAEARISLLQRAVVGAPNDPVAYRKLLEAGLALFDRPGYSIPNDARETIIDRAYEIARFSGVEGLSIGPLAGAVGMSKSGVFAHFGSREDLSALN